jgi:hypothetical protein
MLVRLRGGGCLVVLVRLLARLQILFGLFLGRLHIGFYGLGLRFGSRPWIAPPRDSELEPVSLALKSSNGNAQIV